MKSKQHEKNELSRRDFIKTTAVGVGATALAGLESEEAKAQELIPENWDKEADVVIVGYGGAGAVTAITAHDAGAEVLIVEKQLKDTPEKENQTNSTRLSASCMMNFNTKTGAIKFLTAASRGTTPADVIESWAEYAIHTRDWLDGIGGQTVERPYDTSEYPLSVFPEGAEYTACGHVKMGYGLWQTLSRATESRGIEVLFDCPAQELIQNPGTMEILGVKVRNEGRDQNIRARKAVVLCNGGFEFDFEMLDTYVWAHPCRFTANPANTGDGIKMAQAVGAALWHMPLIGGGPTVYIPDLGVGTGSMSPRPFIWVTKYGKRFMGQPTSPNNLIPGTIPAHTSSYALFHWDFNLCDFPAVPFFSIFDQSAVDRGPVTGTGGVLGLKGQYKWSDDNSEEIKKGWILKGDTIEELAKVIGEDPDVAGKMKPEILADTLAKYNQYCANGVDPEFGTLPTALNPLTKPPYYAMKMYPGCFNTFGGPKRSAKGQVVDAFDKPIARLYSAGELGSILGFLYAGGGWNLCEVVVSGQIAGKYAAAEGSWSKDARLTYR